MQWFGDSCWKIFNLFSAKRWVYETVKHVHPVTKQSTGGPGPFFIISTGGAPSLLFKRMGPFFIISTSRVPYLLFQQMRPLLLHYFIGWAPSLLFQRVGPLLHYFNGLFFWLFQLVHGAPSLLFQRVGPLLCYYKGCTGLCSFVLTFSFLLIVITNFRSNYGQILHFQV